MATRRPSRSGPLGGATLTLGALLTLGGCGAARDGEARGSGGATAAAGPAGAGGAAASSAAGGASQPAGNGGAPAVSGGTSPTGSSGASSLAGAAPGGGGAGGAPLGGGSAGGSSGASGSSGAGGAPARECTRALLDGLLDDYLAALAAGDPSSLPLAPNLRFTENAQAAPLGMTNFWQNAGEAKYSQRALDTEACSVAAQAVIPEGGVDLPVGIRIAVEDGELTEIETIVVRPGDYTASFAVASNPGAIIQAADAIGWHDEVPAAQRASRQQLTSWIDKYFRAFPAGVCNVTPACRRLENGGGNFSCGSGASCSASTPTSGGQFVPRVIIVDELRGIAAGFTTFDYQTTGHLDMHMIKMSGGQVHAVQAILRNTDGESGWD